MRQTLDVRVTQSPEPIDLRAWARRYVAIVLETEGVQVGKPSASSEPPILAEAS